MGSKHNGSGKSTSDKGTGEKIVRLPSLAERDRMRREKEKLERQAARVHNKPFLNTKNIPPFSGLMVLVFIAVHLVLFLVLDSAQFMQALYVLGFVPAYLTGTFGETPWYAPLGLVTHVFVHGGWFHLLVNTVMMLAMGTLFERSYGLRRTAIFFFLCAVIGALVFFALNPSATVPLVGASGGISGLFAAALLLLQQRGQIVSRRGPWMVIIFWAVLMIVIGVITGSIGGGAIAWQAHLGGFLAGAGILHLMQKNKIRF